MLKIGGEENIKKRIKVWRFFKWVKDGLDENELRTRPAESEGMEKQTKEWLSTARERERGMFNTLYVSLSHLLSLLPNLQGISNPSPLLLTHTHTQHRQAEDGKYEHCTAARQQREKWSTEGKYPLLWLRLFWSIVYLCWYRLHLACVKIWMKFNLEWDNTSGWYISIGIFKAFDICLLISL